MATVQKLQTKQDPWTILVRFDRVYGKVTCYPANEQAELICAMTGRKTLTPVDIKTAKAMGFQIVLTYGSWAILEEYLK